MDLKLEDLLMAAVLFAAPCSIHLGLSPIAPIAPPRWGIRKMLYSLFVVNGALLAAAHLLYRSVGAHWFLFALVPLFPLFVIQISIGLVATREFLTGRVDRRP